MEIGDKVKIIDRGCNYPTHEPLLSEMGIGKSMNYCQVSDTTMIYEIYNIQPGRLNVEGPFYGIKNGDVKFIFSENGLALYKGDNKLNDWLKNKIKEFKTL